MPALAVSLFAQLDCDEADRQATLKLAKESGLPAYDIAVRINGNYVQKERAPELQREIRRDFNGSYRLATYGSPFLPGSRLTIDFGCEKTVTLTGGGSFIATEDYSSWNTVTSATTECTKFASIGFTFNYASDRKFHGDASIGLVGAQHSIGRQYNSSDNRWETHTGTDEARQGMSASFNEENSKVEVKDGVYRITGRSNDTDANGGNVTTEQVEWTITIAPLGEYEAFIEPVDEGAFKGWLPLGPLLDPGAVVPLDPMQPNHTHGNATRFQVRVFKVGEKEPVTVPYKTTFRLADVSQNPGWCMNYPVQDPDQEPDLRFFATAAENSLFEKLADDECTTAAAPGPVALTVMSHDYGSHGRLTATVAIDGRRIEAQARVGNEAGALLIPFRTTRSVITDVWRETNGERRVDDKADRDGFDSDIGPAHLGDGFSVYEEYRGFCENGKHVRTDPRQRDYMVRNEVGAAAEDGLALFSSVSGVKTHHKFRATEFGRQRPVDGLPFDKVVNCNHDPAFHVVDQHGVVLRSTTEDTGGAEAILRVPNDPAPWSPARFRYVLIGADFQPGEWHTVMGVLQADGSFTVDPQGQSTLRTNLFAMVVAHELFHTIGVRHHGEEDVGRVSWTADPKDAAVILENAGGATNPVTLINDLSGEPINPSDELFGRLSGKEYWVAVEHGQHSGAEDCIMRYNNASAYARGNTRYFLKNAEGVNRVAKEIADIALCDSPRGTGVNSPSFMPRPRYGDAAPGRGNCKSQVCVSDKR
ncbi:MAG TPA: hypothetical protein VG734_26995 [Lacunisphaera sp.]|nr:hypothetical protein [Lacunisphaera sp.]